MKKFNLAIFIYLIVNTGLLQAQYFTKISGSPVTSNPADSRSVNWIDVNNDNHIDLFISNGPSGGQNNSLYLNSGNGNFTQVLTDSIVLDNRSSDGATFADVNNDGNIDAFVVNWYNQNNLFYLSNGDGTFMKNNSQIVSNDQGYSETAAWGDYNNDGLLDLYVTNSAGIKKNYLYHNDGNNTFSKIIVGDHVNDANFSRNISWVDIDSDGDLDLFVTNENGQNENIYRNDGVNNFTKLTNGALLNDGGNTNSSSWADFDNDGDLDVFLANDFGFNSLFKNEGNFIFTKILNDTVAKTPARSFSSAWSDIDNDGDLDLFVTNSFATGTKLVNYFYINDGQGNFTRNNTDIVAKDSSWSYGCAFGDYDNDGFEDLSVATCRFNGIDFPDFLYHNNGNSNNWITLKLIGTSSNKSAIGAKVKIRSIINGNPVWQLREISSQSSYCGQNDIRIHFGLSNATAIDSLLIIWPLGLIEMYTNVSTNQFLTLIEGASTNGFYQNFISDESLKIYPIPTKKELILELANTEFKNGDKIEIFNKVGKKLMNHINLFGTKSIQISLPNYSPGIYTLVFQRNNLIFITKKIIIQ